MKHYGLFVIPVGNGTEMCSIVLEQARIEIPDRNGNAHPGNVPDGAGSLVVVGLFRLRSHAIAQQWQPPNRI